MMTIAVDTDAYDADRDFAGSIEECYRAIRARVAAGGPGWRPRLNFEPMVAAHDVARRADIADLRRELADMRQETAKFADGIISSNRREFESLRRLILTRLPPAGRG